MDFLYERSGKRAMVIQRFTFKYWPNTTLQAKLDDVSASMLARVKQEFGHRNDRRGNAAPISSMSLVRAGHYNRNAFIEATGASLVAAARYLNNANDVLHIANDVLHIAIDRYLQGQAEGDDEDVEEIEIQKE